MGVLKEVADGTGDWDIREEEVRGSEDASRWAVCRVRLARHIVDVEVEVAEKKVDELMYASKGFIGRRMPVTSIGPAIDDSRVVTIDDEG